MSINGRSRIRRETSRERRARDYVRRHEDHAQSKHPISATEMIAQIGAFMIKRPLLSLPGDVSQRAKFQKLVRNTRDATALGWLGASLINPADGRRLLLARDIALSDMCDELKTASYKLPETREGFIGRAIIVGVQEGRPGQRFVGFGMDDGLCAELLQDKRSMIAAAQAPHTVTRGRRMHVSLVKTYDSQLANELRDAFDEIWVPETPVILGKPEVVPIAQS